MTGYLKRLLSSLGAYQAANVVAKVIGVAMLPVYTAYIARAGYGTIELLANGVILISILTRLGMIEAFLRFYYEDEDLARRDHLVRRAAGFMLIATTIVAGLLLVFAGTLSRVALGPGQAEIFRVAVLGLWSFTNLELAYAVLRVDERLRAYATASVCNVLLTVAATVTLVVGAGLGARGYLLGNYGASTLVLLALWWTMRLRLRAPRRAAGHSWATLMRFGLPTVPAEASVYLLSIVDRAYIYHARSAGTAGLYALALKLAGAVSFIVTAFMYAWPPLAYSVTDDREAGRLYGLVATYYLLATGWVVAALALEGGYIVRLLSHPSYYGAARALPWVALGWALYGLWVILLTIAGRAKATTRNFPAALLGLAVNVGLLLLLVPQWGIAGAGIALCGAYVAMLAFMHGLTRSRFHVQFEWWRLVRLAVVVGGLAAAGDALLPARGAGGLLLRALVVIAIGPALLAVGFVHPEELRQGRMLLARIRRGRAFAARGGA
ncbi:MAG TPA: lipopolysaccharide biosynthesis protein [Solirubrobacteraceae bacterium]|nr:lipopolysaccharide biosynthesis protein [Solirubrobacteraceae bacterium]